MRKLFLLLLCVPFIGLAQQTYVPDDNFEAFLEANGMGNGISNDDYVTTANINTVTHLSLSSNGIADLTGIEDFVALTSLDCQSNQLTSLDVSANTALTYFQCSGNSLASLDVSTNTSLGTLSCGWNNLISLDVSANTSLAYLYCGFNQITTLDLSTNTNLVNLECPSNGLTSLTVSGLNAITHLYLSLIHI